MPELTPTPAAAGINQHGSQLGFGQGAMPLNGNTSRAFSCFFPANIPYRAFTFGTLDIRDSLFLPSHMC